MALVAGGAFTDGAELSSVELDPGSGVFSSRFPFDVPFVIAGKAPPGTTRVEMVYREKRALSDAFGEPRPPSPLVAGVDAEGRFRIQMPAVAPNHYFEFRLTLERRIRAGETLPAALKEVLRRELASLTRAELDAARARAIQAAIRDRFERALNQGQIVSRGRGQVETRAPSPLFDEGTSEERLIRELSTLAEPLFAAQAQREDSLGQYRETVRSFLGDLTRVSRSPELRTLLEALEKRPEIDPRSSRSALHLSREARSLVGVETASLQAIAEGASLTETGADLEGADNPEEADGFQERYRRVGQALQELRDWLQSLVVGGAENRRFVDALVQSRELTGEEVDRLAELGSLSRGSIRRAEQWAESLEVYARDVARAVRARERAFASMAAGLEAQALAAVVRQEAVSEVVSSEAGIYVSMDLGILYPPELERAAVYVGANVYLQPVNKRAPLRGKGSLGQRLGLTFGITLTNLKLEDETRYENLLGERSNLLLGAGLRVTRSLRVGGGVLLFLKNDPNPLVTDRSLAATPYVGVSFDVDLVGALRSLTQ